MSRKDDSLNGIDEARLDRDLALLMQTDPAPVPDGALMARILADAADVGAQRAAPASSAMRGAGKRRPFAWLRGLMNAAPAGLSAGVAAACLGLWLGWTDAAGIMDYADALADLSGSGQEQDGLGAALFDLGDVYAADTLLDMEI